MPYYHRGRPPGQIWRATRTLVTDTGVVTEAPARLTAGVTAELRLGPGDPALLVSLALAWFPNNPAADASTVPASAIWRVVPYVEHARSRKRCALPTITSAAELTQQLPNGIEGAYSAGLLQIVASVPAHATWEGVTVTSGGTWELLAAVRADRQLPPDEWDYIESELSLDVVQWEDGAQGVHGGAALIGG